MFNIDVYLDRKYNQQTQHCGHFVTQVWKDLTGQDISIICEAFLTANMILFREYRKRYTRLSQPENPCIVAMQNTRFHETHVGIYVDGRILHLAEEGVKYETLETLDPRKKMLVSYYT